MQNAGVRNWLKNNHSDPLKKTPLRSRKITSSVSHVFNAFTIFSAVIGASVIWTPMAL